MLFQMDDTLIEVITTHFRSLVGSFSKAGDWTFEDQAKILDQVKFSDVLIYKKSNFLYHKTTDKQVVLELEGIKFHHIKSLHNYTINIDGLFKLIIIDYKDLDKIQSKWSVDYYKGDPSYIGCTSDEVPARVELNPDHVEFLDKLHKKLPKVLEGHKYLFRIEFQDNY